MKQQVYRINATKLKKPESNKVRPSMDWFMPSNDKLIRRVEVRKYQDGEILVDIILESK